MILQIKINDWNINYETYGNGKPVVLLHGWLTDLESMRPLTTGLEKTHKISYNVYRQKITDPEFIYEIK